MRRKKRNLPLLERVLISDVAAEGKAIAKVDDMVVFVPYVVPGDVVDIQLTKKKKNFAEGRIVEIHEYSAVRQEPFCEHFGVCGGCKWQNLPYDEQLRYKQKQVIDNLERIGKVEIGETLPILGSEPTVGYRNKLEYTFSNRRWLPPDEMGRTPEETELNGAGFHIPGRFDKVLDIRKCWLQDDISNRIRLFIKNLCLSNEWPFFDLKAQTGFIRNVIIRTSSTGELMVIVVFFEDDEAKRCVLLDAVRDNFPEITSLMYVVNSKCNDTITDLKILSYCGKDHLIETMEDLRFKVGPKSFYQTNSLQANRLYSVVREFAALTGTETVYDLYTGTGTIANFIARQAGRVVGIEYVPEAIEDAKINAELNGISNIRFFAGDIKDLLSDAFIAENGRPDVVITDPPRTGMHDKVTDTILAAMPSRIVYVSCNPATQARDLNRMSSAYRVERIRPVDMFPHTHHVENVALLIRI
ncbi:MAG: 23S rRNA (uracil(1939)-C(5))-methyltransferase RlmD [Tannerella sp.]|nr:23S rRNA (uracil(1939)-C(5))-methyltransferase RlmD [Tannerella sp.]